MTEEQAKLKIDCFSLLADLHRCGINNSEVARRIGVAISTVRNWKNGCEPKYSDGQRLIEMHAHFCQKSSILCQKSPSET